MFAVIFTIGFLFRFLMLVSQKSPWGDEWFTIGIVQQPLPKVFFDSLQDVHPFLYNVVLCSFIHFLGAQEWAFRLLSFLASLGTLVFVYLLTREFFGKEEARLASFFVAISPYWLQSSNEIRSYSLLAFVVLTASFAFIKMLGYPGKKWRVIYILAAVAAIYIEHYAWFWFLGTTTCALFLHLKNKNGREILRRQAIVFLAGIPSLAIIAYQALFKENMFQVGRMQEYFSVAVMLKKIVGLFWHFSCGYFFSMVTVEGISHYLKTSFFFWLSAVSTVAAFSFALKGFFKIFKERPEIFVLWLMVLYFPVVLLGVFYPIRLDARYLSFAAPFFFITLAYGVMNVSRFWIRTVFITIFSAVSLFGSFHAILSPTDSIHKEDHRALVEYALRHAGPRDAFCGLKPQMDYYRPRLGTPPDLPIFSSYEDLAGTKTSRFEKIWFLGITNMQPEVADRIFKDICLKMARLGFYPDFDPLRFGGREGLTVLYVFQNKSSFMAQGKI